MSEPANPFETPPPSQPRPVAPSRPWLRALGVVLLSAFGTGSCLGAYRGYEASSEAAAAVVEYDSLYDPIVIEGGVLRVEGPRVPSVPGSFYVDPNDEIDLDAIDGEAIVMGRTELVQVRAFDQRSYRYSDVLEGRTIRMDSTNGAAFLDTYGHWIGIGIAALLVCFVAPIHVVGCGLLSLLAGWLAGLLLRSAELSYGAVATRALTFSAALPLIWSIANLAGMSTNCCVDLFVLGPLLTLATWTSLRKA